MRHTLHAASYHDAVFTVGGALTVRAVFQRAWHLHLESNEVLTVTVVPYDGPMCVRVRSESLKGLPVVPGMVGHLREAALVVGSVRVILDKGVVWRPYGDTTPLPLIAAALAGDLREIPADLASEPRDMLLDWSRRAIPTMDGLECSLIDEDIHAAGSLGAELLGLGPGLTPSGDDILCGLLAGLRIFGLRSQGGVPACAAQLGARLAADAVARTTPLSRTLLSWAARGVAVQPLLDVLWTLGSGNPVRGVDQLVDIGHSSGRDMLAGASLAARVIIGWKEIHGSALAPSA